MKIDIPDITHLESAARQFVQEIGDSRVIAFYGKMGAGKTTFIKAICQQLGVTDTVTSPTFAIVNQYEASPLGMLGEVQIFHFDFYRIHRIEEAYDMGYEDYFYHPNALCLIEWPEVIEPLLPPDTLKVSINENPDGSRTLLRSNT